MTKEYEFHGNGTFPVEKADKILKQYGIIEHKSWSSDLPESASEFFPHFHYMVTLGDETCVRIENKSNLRMHEDMYRVIICGDSETASRIKEELEKLREQ